MHYRPCSLHIDLARISANVRAIRSALRPGVALMAVVKADGYGHGAVAVARVVLAAGAQCLAVALPEEGEALRLAGISAPLLVMGAANADGAQAAARLNLQQTVFDPQGVAHLAQAAARQGVRVGVHVKVDSGMGRLGVRDAGALADLVDQVRSSPHLTLAGIFTHFACADEADEAYSCLQRTRFEAMLRACDLTGVVVHGANSAATLRFPWAQYQAVRVGIALYGAPPVETGLDLAPAQRWAVRGALVKTIAPGEKVSYGGQFQATRPTQVMTLPVGYADGYRRCLSGRAQVLVRGRRAPVIGRICMDQTMIDVTDIPGAMAGDEVVLLGSQGEGAITPVEMAGWMDSITYEVMLSPSARVPRFYLPEVAP